jgi:hypothetical protein
LSTGNERVSKIEYIESSPPNPRVLEYLGWFCSKVPNNNNYYYYCHLLSAVKMIIVYN